ncbi:MAG TPA: FecR domain-containing protein [Puia sp.]|nr:FecR domain-containing protein [Puia sp.]
MDEKTKHKSILEQRFWLLVSLQLTGEATAEELAELTALLRDYPEWSLRMELFSNIWRQSSKTPESASNGDTRFNRHLQRLSNHLSDPVLEYEEPTPPAAQPETAPPVKHLRARKAWTTAAAITGAALLIGLYQASRHSGSRDQNQPDGLNTVSTRPGSRSRLQLPDGTLVWLNADSRLSYKMDRGDQNREVTLTGEAYFDVAHDKEHPFIIHTNTIDIRVLGTTFDVECYGNDKHTETSLFQGSVEITLKNNPARKIVLQPSEKLIVHNDDIAITNIPGKTRDADEPLMTLGKVHYQRKDSSYIETLWTKNQLAFDDRTLEDVAHQIERWYGARVIITDDRLKAARFTGVFEDESLDQVMEALQMTGNFHYTIRKKEVTITP